MCPCNRLIRSDVRNNVALFTSLDKHLLIKFFNLYSKLSSRYVSAQQTLLSGSCAPTKLKGALLDTVELVRSAFRSLFADSLARFSNSKTPRQIQIIITYDSQSLTFRLLKLCFLFGKGKPFTLTLPTIHSSLLQIPSFRPNNVCQTLFKGLTGQICGKIVKRSSKGLGTLFAIANRKPTNFSGRPHLKFRCTL